MTINCKFAHGNPGLKHLLFVLFINLLPCFSATGQDTESSTEKYSKKVYSPEYAIRFKDIEDQKSFKKLREFLKQKESLLAALNARIESHELEGYATDTLAIKDLNSEINKLSKAIEGKKADDSIKVKYGLLNPGANIFTRIGRRNPDSLVMVLVAEVREKIIALQNDIEDAKIQFDSYTNLEKSISNVKDDIEKCGYQIESALAPEYQQQNFRKTISISFSVLIGMLLCIFFFIVYRRSDNNLSKELLSGNGLQFITLFVLIIAVILFGILNILGSSELAAILSGISGYILGKGTQKDLSSAMHEREQQQAGTSTGNTNTSNQNTNSLNP